MTDPHVILLFVLMNQCNEWELLLDFSCFQILFDGSGLVASFCVVASYLIVVHCALIYLKPNTMWRQVNNVCDSRKRFMEALRVFIG
jgi:hypothetical protein